MSHTEDIPHPPIVTEEEWLAERVSLLAEEKAHTREMDRINAKRRRLGMVKVGKDYVFEGTEGKKSLLDLFEGRRQLIVYHFMFEPASDVGCPGCTSYINAINDLSDLPKRDTTFVMISRAPLEKLQKYKAEQGWAWNWLSSGGTDFNYDFNVTIDPAVMEPVYNYKDTKATGEMPGTSIFFRIGEDVYHSYSCYARGGESTTHSYALLDLTPYGRQEDFEDSPEGWPQRPTYG